jgi:hypothetical protein
MAGRYTDLTGKIYGRLTPIECLGKNPQKKSNSVEWKCICECGNKCVVRATSLLQQHTTSCGCYMREKNGILVSERNTTHGQSSTRVYAIWEGMLKRCFNPKSQAYKNYGGRGISVCDKWLSFEGFYNDMGDVPDGLSLERVDVNGDYSPDNCKWADTSEQAYNQRRREDNTSGRVGVHKTRNGKWAAQIG